MNIQDLHLLYDYHFWVNQHLLSFCDKLTHAQVIAPNNYSNHSLKATLVHLVSAQWIWLQRCRDGVFPAAMLNNDDFATLDAVKQRWANEEAQCRAWLAVLTDADLAREIHYRTQNGQEYSNTLWHIFSHIVTHGMQHHSEVAQMLTDFGYSPGNIDLIVYLREYRAVA